MFFLVRNSREMNSFFYFGYQTKEYPKTYTTVIHKEVVGLNIKVPLG
jgi:hypothetical protein